MLLNFLNSNNKYIYFNIGTLFEIFDHKVKLNRKNKVCHVFRLKDLYACCTHIWYIIFCFSFSISKHYINLPFGRFTLN